MSPKMPTLPRRSFHGAGRLADLAEVVYEAYETDDALWGICRSTTSRPPVRS